MSKFRVTEPSMNDVLDAFKAEVFRDLNCVKQGEIVEYDPATASCTVKLKIKEFVDVDADTSVSYPLLADVPVFVLQGGGAWMELPIAEGDPCLVLFSDRDIDNWWTSGNETTPNTQRRHSLSDGIALVGINPKSNPLALTGQARIFAGAHKLDFANNLQVWSQLMAELVQDIIDLRTFGSPGAHTLDPGSIAAFNATLTKLQQLFGED